MTARAIVAQTVFSNPNLPVINLGLTPPVFEASMDFTAKGLPEGELLEWYDNVNGNVLRTVAGSPKVVTESGERIVRFNGIDDLMDMALSMSQPRHIGIVARARAINAGATTILGSPAINGVLIGSNSTNTNQYVNAGASLNANPAKPLDTGWHVYVARVNNTSSNLLIDGVVTTGSAGTNTFPGIRLGGSYNVPENTALDVKRFVIVPGAGTAGTAAAIYSELKA